LMGLARGFSFTDIAFMMNAIILGGVALQLPFGHLSDRWSRHGTITLICLVGLISSAAAFIFPGLHQLPFLFLMLCFGGCALSLYSVCASTGQATTRLARVETASCLLLVHGLGSVIGPLLAAYVGMFTSQAVFLVSLMVFATLAVAALALKPATGAEVHTLSLVKNDDILSLSEAA